MPGYLAFDLETAIDSDVETDGKGVKFRKLGLHGGSWKEPNNDFYTIIYGDHPERIKLLHSKKGFNRKLPYRVAQMLHKSHTIIGANLKFDMGYIWKDSNFQRWLANGGQIWDIQLVHYLLTAQRHSFPSLYEMQKIYLGAATKDKSISRVFKRGLGADIIVNKNTQCSRIWNDYLHYSVEDGRTPMLIMQKQHRKAKELGMLPIIKLYNEYLLALTMIEVNGLPIDIPLTEQRYQEFSLKMLEYLKKASDMVKHLWTDKRLPEFNVNSPTHSSAILFGGTIKCTWKERTGEVYGPKAKKAGQKKYKNVSDDVRVGGFGVPIGYTTETKVKGRYSTGEDVINTIYEKCKNQEAIEYCKALKMAKAYKQKISTYLDAFLYKAIDGLIHPNYNNTETITSRLSASQPNVQNIPKHGMWGKLIQGIIAAPTGWVCCQIDYSQLEVYCRALLAMDPTLISDLVSGRDFHCQNVAWWKQVTYEQAVQKCKVEKDKEWGEYRSQAKPISFGEAYGQMPESMAQNTGIPLEIVEQIYKSMQENYPNLVVFEESVVKEVQNNARMCKKTDLPAKLTRGTKDSKGLGRKFIGNMELLPIRNRDKKTYCTRAEEPRHVGFFVSPTGKRYAFEEYGSITKRGDVFRYYKPTQMKNYAMQGTAGDVQASSTVEMFQFLLQNQDKVRIINEIHDSKWFLIKEEHVDTIVPQLTKFMEDTSSILKRRFGIDVPFEFKADAEIGPNFAELEEFKI
tara:strand:+ start:8237 stop:10456 length:2220 start_codon:yes stop_codon:yes gene_type:complete